MLNIVQLVQNRRNEGFVVFWVGNEGLRGAISLGLLPFFFLNSISGL